MRGACRGRPGRTSEIHHGCGFSLVVRCSFLSLAGLGRQRRFLLRRCLGLAFRGQAAAVGAALRRDARPFARHVTYWSCSRAWHMAMRQTKSCRFSLTPSTACKDQHAQFVGVQYSFWFFHRPSARMVESNWLSSPHLHTLSATLEAESLRSFREIKTWQSATSKTSIQGDAIARLLQKALVSVQLQQSFHAFCSQFAKQYSHESVLKI